jgi:TM2 domain-containing membrane protein YozV
MTLSTQERILIEQRIANDAKSIVVAYLLLIFFGGFGAHRFYLGRTGSAVAMLLLFIVGWLTLVVVIGFALLLVVGIWAIVDIFLVPGMIQVQKETMRQRLTQEILLSERPPATRTEPLLTSG